MKNLVKIYIVSLACMLFSCSSIGNDVNSEITTVNSVSSGRTFYRGTTLAYAEQLQQCGTVFKENNIPTSPYTSIKNHGGNITRVAIALPPYSNDITMANTAPGGNTSLNFRTFDAVKAQMQKAKAAGLSSFLSFNLTSHALNPNQKLNSYVAPLAWQPIASNLPVLKDSVYNYVYSNLKKLVQAGLVPPIITIGNETNWRICEPNVVESSLSAYNATRVVGILNAGTKAVRDVNTEFGLDMKVGVHLADASKVKWWMNLHMPAGLDIDFLGLSFYNGWHTMGTFTSWADVVNYIKTTYGKEFLIVETAMNFRPGYSDGRGNVLSDNQMIPVGYPNPSTTVTQRSYMANFSQQLYDAGGLGIIYWGGDYVGSNNCYIFPDTYGVGSSWENKAFWDFSNNLHDGVNWMQDLQITMKKARKK